MAAEAEKFISESEAKPLILIVDDEISICKTLEDVFRDEGYASISANDGLSALALLQETKPSLVLLDIWMPGLDGIETLKKIKEICPQLPVIMISGHATIATAIQATKIGAADFIEKPLDLDTILSSVKSALSDNTKVKTENETENKESIEEDLPIGQKWNPSQINNIAFHSQAMRGRKLVQKTLAHSTLLYGQGLHSGTKSGLILEPLPPNSGIHFCGMSEDSLAPAHVSFVESTGFATSLKHLRTQVNTIEHLMSAMHVFGISNLLIKCNDEVPVMDGSATEFCNLIEETGLVEQEGEWYEIEIDEIIRIGDDQQFIQIEPADNFIIDYALEYPEPLGSQHMVFNLDDVKAYKQAIAPARTFGLVKDIGALHKAGLAQGGRFDNFVLIGEDGAINDELRFADEAVRHKILDAIGDFYLLGRPIKGKVTARMTGHSDNIAVVKEIYRRFDLSQV